ncbi:pentapeptide repeat-containing protein [Streptomyces sp. N2A]|uniref:pentapeptide repeat-containing protein n=1 Tax=Streptomyces sp. N2A TaxID=3073936 RepID=UPI00286FFABB|nr:pentapeptide repeat-containing protein [Streptomyces sp. N2A]
MRLTQWLRTSRTDRELRLWKVGLVLPLTFLAAIAVAAAVFRTGWDLLDVHGLKPERRIDSKTLFDLVKLSFGVVAGAGALVALVVAYRRQRVDEAGAHREDTRLHTERFSQAVDKLGSDSPAVQLGGVHALAGLADDAPDDSLRQTCIDVLCAYLQLPFTPDPGDDPAHQEEHHHYLALRKVRHTILHLIGDHYRRPQGTHRSWQGCNIDLTGVIIDGHLDFSGAAFSGSTVSFRDATFSGGMVDFGGATISSGDVYFARAAFSGSKVSFKDATFSGGAVSFGRATFSGGTVDFYRARFSGSDVFFGRATFSGGTVTFNFATFSDGRVDLGAGVRFSGAGVFFSGATFSGGRVFFSGATFSSGRVFLGGGATFSGGRVFFDGARFSGGTVSFSQARFSGGTVSFDGATGSIPSLQWI